MDEEDLQTDNQKDSDNILIARYIIMVTAFIFQIITQIAIFQSNRTRFWPFFLMQIYFTYNLLYYILFICEGIFNLSALCPYYGFAKYVLILTTILSQLILLYFYLMMLLSFYPEDIKQKEYYIYLSEVIRNNKMLFLTFLNIFSAITILVPLLQSDFNVTSQQYLNNDLKSCNFELKSNKQLFQYIGNWVVLVILSSIVTIAFYIKISSILKGKYVNCYEHKFMFGICKIPTITLIFQLLAISTLIGGKYYEKQEGYQYYIFLTLSFIDEASIILTNFIFLKQNYSLVQMKRLQVNPIKQKAILELAPPVIQLDSNKQMFISSAEGNKWNEDSSITEDEKYILMIEDLFKHD